MQSFGGIGGDFDDFEFCDTSPFEPVPALRRAYPWWNYFAEGKRFYVPRVSQLNGVATHFNVSRLVTLGSDLIEEYSTHYRNASDFGRKSFDKILVAEPMSFAKAVLATRVINADLADRRVVDASNKILQIGRGEILAAAYRVEGLKRALAFYEELTRGQTEAEGAVEFLKRSVSGVAPSIVEELCADDGRLIVFPTAREVAAALLRERARFGILPKATELELIRLGPPTNRSTRRLDLPMSVSETQDRSFIVRCSHYRLADNPYAHPVA